MMTLIITLAFCYLNVSPASPFLPHTFDAEEQAAMFASVMERNAEQPNALNFNIKIFFKKSLNSFFPYPFFASLLLPLHLLLLLHSRW